jgi:uncharacterized protein YceH (UPF0502 family)
MNLESQPGDTSAAPRWQPLESIERRVLGVLIEKAKTTPENYPLSLNSIKTGCNQKNNRAPLMQLEEEQVEQALESLRKAGAVAQIQGGGRVDKYRHLAYDWLGVEKVELAVMAELLLRGTQTVGELRGRAARMEPIKDLSELEPTLDSLHAKGLIVYLSPPGRGSVVTHALYLEREMEKVQREAGLMPRAEPAYRAHVGRIDESPTPQATAANEGHAAKRAPVSPAGSPSDATAVAQQLERLQAEVAALKRDLLAVRGEFETSITDLRRGLDELNRQLGN